MPYIKEVCMAGKTLEIEKYYSVRYHPKGERRAQKENPSSEAVRRNNLRRAVKHLRRLMNANFQDGDYLVRLDFHKEKPEDSIQMQELMQKAMRKLKTEYRKTGKELKYIYVKEVGPKGGRHIHMMMNKCDPDIIRRSWNYGGIHIDPLTSNGQYSKIAEYFLKYSERTETTEEKLIGKRWYASRNLEKPVVKKKLILACKFKEKMHVPKGWYLEKESIRSGISEVTGFEYMSYTLIKAEVTARSQ